MQPYPEKIYFRNSIVIGDLPNNLDLNKLFDYFDDISFWKLNGKKVISDLQNPSLKAVILTYDDEESARMCSLRLKSITSISFTLYDGIALFHYCTQLELTCDHKSKNILVSGMDINKSQDAYLDLLGNFGTICYFEFCSEGDIPKFRVEFTRVTSAFAALLSLQTALGENAVITMEMPLFPIYPIGPFECKPNAECTSLAAHHKVTTTHDAKRVPEEMKEQALTFCTMNFYQQDQQTFTNFNAFPEKFTYQRDIFDEYMMEAVSVGVSRKLFREKFCVPRIIPRYIQDCFERYSHENVKNFLQSTRKIMNFNHEWNEMLPPRMRRNYHVRMFENI